MKRFIVPLFLLVLAISACMPTYKPVENTSEIQQVSCVAPESDNSYRWKMGSCVEINRQVYTVSVTVVDEIVNHTETNAAGGGNGFMINGIGTYSSSFRMWQDGKGILPVQIMAIDPSFRNLLPGDYILLKTSDLKAMALPNGSKAQFVCNQDVEVLSPIENDQILTTDRLTYELDDCRMISPQFWPPQ